ncbi:MAG: hypothetical protein R6U63_00475 [Longimicrobiales bacterium]
MGSSAEARPNRGAARILELRGNAAAYDAAYLALAGALAAPPRPRRRPTMSLNLDDECRTQLVATLQGFSLNSVRPPGALVRAGLLTLLAALTAGCDAGDGGPAERSGEAPPAEATAEASELDRAALCEGIHNVYECSRVVEERLLSAGVEGVERSGDTLTIALSDAGERVLVDHGARAETVLYTYGGHLARVGYHVVQIHYYEGGEHLLIDDETGEETRVAARPVVSPDGRRMVIASFGGMAGYVPDLLQVRRVTPDGLDVEWEVRPDDWGAADPRWVDSTTVRFTKRSICEPGRTCEDPAVLRLEGGEWTIVDAGGARNET